MEENTKKPLSEIVFNVDHPSAIIEKSLDEIKSQMVDDTPFFSCCDINGKYYLVPKFTIALFTSYVSK